MNNYYIFKKYFFTFVIIFFTGLYTYSMAGEYEEGNEVCPVCFEEFKEDKKIIVLPCKHSFCKNCCYGHIKQQITTNIEKIYCMTCPNPKNAIENKNRGFFTKDQCLKILKEEDKENFEVLKQSYEKWERRVIINSSNGTIKACPYKFPLGEGEGVADCAGMLKKDGHNQYSKCEICTNEFCFKCLRTEEEHKEKSCEKYLEEMQKKDEEILLGVYGKNNIKKCPYCGSPTEKNDGCNHMRCAKCGGEWCWLCETKLFNPTNSGYPLHYNLGQCKDKQFDKSDEKIEKDCVGWMLYILCCDCIF